LLPPLAATLVRAAPVPQSPACARCFGLELRMLPDVNGRADKREGHTVAAPATGRKGFAFDQRHFMRLMVITVVVNSVDP
jgi:hypothetical protein